MQNAIDVHGVRRRFGEVLALDGLSFGVAAGSVCCLLGPNGAGKTSAVRVLSTLLRADEGTARVAGFDVRTDPYEVRRRIGVTGQYASIDEALTPLANLTMTGRLLGLRKSEARARARALLARFDLADRADAPVATLSGGMPEAT